MSVKKQVSTFPSVVLGIVLVVVLMLGGMASNGHASSISEWSTYASLPGVGEVNPGSSSSINSVACLSAGNCVAIGSYFSSNGSQGFAIRQVDGVWQSLHQFYGGHGSSSSVSVISCVTVRDCTVVGGVTGRSPQTLEVFVASMTDGVWGEEFDIPGLNSANVGGEAFGTELSCPSVGNCTVAGNYSVVAESHTRVFVASQTNGTWGSFESIPNLNTANAGRISNVSSLVCITARNCTVGGFYGVNGQVFVATQSGGVWGGYESIPGLNAVNSGRRASVGSLVCVSVGNCTVGGSYSTDLNATEVFVATQSGGVWGGHRPISTTNDENLGIVSSEMSCPASNNCLIVGSRRITGNFPSDGGIGSEAFFVMQNNGVWGTPQTFTDVGVVSSSASIFECSSANDCLIGGVSDSHGKSQAFVMTMTSGQWGMPNSVPGLDWAARNFGSQSLIDSSCVSSGNCTIVGSYKNENGKNSTYVSVQSAGNWSSIESIPGLEELGLGNRPMSISCASIGNCVIAGIYVAGPMTDGNEEQLYLATQTNGTWGSFVSIPNLEALNTGGYIYRVELFCNDINSCSLAGSYSNNGQRSFVVTKRNGIWGNPEFIPGLNEVDAVSGSSVFAMSCPGSGNCTLGGYFTTQNVGHAFVATQTNGTWGRYELVPGLDVVSQGDAVVQTLSCASVGNCTAVGQFFTNAGVGIQIFVVTQSNGMWGQYQILPGLIEINRVEASAFDISCASPGNCTLGGTYFEAGTGRQALVATQFQGEWSRPAVIPGVREANSGNEAVVSKVSCREALFCRVIGGYYSTVNGSKPFTSTLQTRQLVQEPSTTVAAPTNSSPSPSTTAVVASTFTSTTFGQSSPAEVSPRTSTATPTSDTLKPPGVVAIGSTSTSVTTPKVTLSKPVSTKSIAAFAKLKVLSTSKVSLKVIASSSKYCKVSGTTLKGVKTGSCKVTVTVTPKKGRATSKTVTLKVTK